MRGRGARDAAAANATSRAVAGSALGPRRGVAGSQQPRARGPGPGAPQRVSLSLALSKLFPVSPPSSPHRLAL